MNNHFMQPEVYEGDYLVIDGTNGTTFLPIDIVEIPKDWSGSFTNPSNNNFDLLYEKYGDYYNGEINSFEIANGKLYRLSAPGYLNCTDWTVNPSKLEG